jgi:hypothetical protein
MNRCILNGRKIKGEKYDSNQGKSYLPVAIVHE